MTTLTKRVLWLFFAIAVVAGYTLLWRSPSMRAVREQRRTEGFERRTARAAILAHGFRCESISLVERKAGDDFFVVTCPEARYALEENHDPPPDLNVLPLN